MQKHLSNIFDPKSGNTVMFAFDHGYFMGSTAGLERLDLLLPQLAPYVDCFMGTRGAIRTCVSPEVSKGIALRVSSGSSMLQSDLSHEVVAVDIEDAIRMNADCMAVQTFIGADGQLSSIDNLSQVINAGFRYSIPTLGVCAVGKDMERTGRFFKLATRIIAEMGCQIVKTYDCEDFEEVVAACPVQLLLLAARSLLSATLCTLHTTSSARVHAALTWAVTSSRAPILCRWLRLSAWIVRRGRNRRSGMGVLRGRNPLRARTRCGAAGTTGASRATSGHKCAAQT